jgi:Phospholipase_D-nuclease N-terminal
MMELLSILEPALGLILWQLLISSIILLGIIAFIDVAMNKFENNQQLLWFLICIFVPFGGLLYFSIGRKQRIKAS